MDSAGLEGGGFDGEHVHAVDGPGGHAVGRSAHREVGLRVFTGQARSHGVQVVLTDQQQGQPPQCREVGRFVELTFREGAVTEEATGDTSAATHPVGKCESGRQRQPTGHDRVATVETAVCIEQVHRTAVSTAATGDFAVHLGHYRVGGHTAGQSMPVLAVGGHHGVLLAQGLVHANGDGLLTNVEVDESSDLRAAVELDAPFFESADDEHLPEEGKTVIGCGRAVGSGGGRLLARALARCRTGSFVGPRGGGAHRRAFSRECVIPGSRPWTGLLRAAPFRGHAAPDA